jgi:hypothetical protein
MASACARTVASSIFRAKWFQLFQPIGGVAATCGDCAEPPDEKQKTRHKIAKANADARGRARNGARQIGFMRFLLVDAGRSPSGASGSA